MADGTIPVRLEAPAERDARTSFPLASVVVPVLTDFPAADAPLSYAL
jgi:hypothetical protein